MAARAVDNLKTCCYKLKHFDKTQRPLDDFGFFNAQIIQAWKVNRQAESDYEEPEDLQTLEKTDEALFL